MIPPAIVQILLILVITGILLWGLQHLPIDQSIRDLIRVLVIVLVAIWLVMILAAMLGYPLTR